jgi:hypothetical protein
MKKKKMLSLLSMVVCAVMLFLAGCQPVGGLDLNQMMISQLGMKSYEGKASFTIDLNVDDSMLTSEEKLIYQLFAKSRLEITDMKVQNLATMSMKGNYIYSNGTIPFAINYSPEQYVIEIEGAERPIVIPSEISAGDVPAEAKAIQETLIDKYSELLQVFGAFIVPNLPNPEHISVEKASVEVNGEALDLYQINAEVYGSEFIDLLVQTVENMIADEEGLKTFLGQLYDALVPVIQELVAASGGEQDDPAMAMILAYLENKTLAVEFAYTTIQTQLAQFSGEIDAALAEMAASAGLVFNDDSYIKMQLFVDEDFTLRKQDFEVAFTPPAGMSSLQKISVAGGYEFWNVNQPVEIESIDTSNAFVAKENTKTAHFLKTVDKSSKLYELLVKDLKVTKKSVRLNMNEDQYGVEFSNRPYIKNSVTLVPVRFVSENLDAEVSWNQANKQVTVIDILTDKKIVLTVGSKVAYVDGKEVVLETSAEINHNSTYVPVRFIAESLGATVQWDQVTRVISIGKE